MKESNILVTARKELKKGKAGIARALASIERASKNGDASAAYGIGTKQDRRLARFWLDRAKSLGRS